MTPHALHLVCLLRWLVRVFKLLSSAKGKKVWDPTSYSKSIQFSYYIIIFLKKSYVNKCFTHHVFFNHSNILKHLHLGYPPPNTVT